MPSRVFKPLVEVFLLVEQPRQRLSHWSRALAPLDDAKAPPVATIDAYYDPSSNQAIFGLRYDDKALGPERLRYIVEIAVLAEIGMIQPAELSEGDRRRFLGERLASCTVHVSDQRKIVNALVELVRRVRMQKGVTTPPAEVIVPHLSRTKSPVPSTPGMSGVRDAPDPQLVLAAKGTRNGPGGGPSSEPLLPRATRDLAHGSARQPRLPPIELDPGDIDDIPDAELKRVVSEPFEATTSPRFAGALLPQRREQGQRPSPNVIARAGVHRANTVTMSTSEAQRMLEAAAHAGEPESMTEPVTDQYLATPTMPNEPGMIYARYLRAGRWVPLRIGALSLKGAALMAGALPRIDDRVDVALAYANHRALVRGAVAKVSTMEEAETSGATTFSVNFELDEGSRRELTALLTAARAANVMIKPPPPRSTRRYPVEWPVCLGTSRGAVRADALDVSTGGMFVRPVNALALDANLTFSAVLDDTQPPVSGHARVVRNLSDGAAKVAGLSPGYGLAIVDMTGADRDRWHQFVARIEKRSARRVLIGASAARLGELQSVLIAAGYAVTGASEAGVIAQLASAEAQPVDAALIDAAWLVGEKLPSRIESLFASRSIPCVTMHGDAKRARVAIDRLLAVV